MPTCAAAPALTSLCVAHVAEQKDLLQLLLVHHVIALCITDVQSLQVGVCWGRKSHVSLVEQGAWSRLYHWLRFCSEGELRDSLFYPDLLV